MNAMGVGKTDTPKGAGYFGGSADYNPNAANLGVDYRRYAGLGNEAAQRGFIQGDPTHANEARGLGLTARLDQAQALELMRRRAMGLDPSMAEMAGKRQMADALAQQQSAVAATRGGPGAQAAAARAAMLGGAQIRGNVASGTALAAAQERAAAEQAYMQGATGMRGSDMGLQGLDQQYSLGQGQLALGSQGQNDAYSLGLYGLQNQAAMAEAAGRVAQQGNLAGSYANAAGLQAQANQYNANRDYQAAQQTMGGAMGAAQAYAASKAAGGSGGNSGGGGGTSRYPDPGY